MWMLTAGFATPIMSALICNGLTPTLSKYLDGKMDKIADRKLSNFSNEITKFDFSKQVESLNEVLNENKGKPLTPEILDSIHAKLTDGLDFVTSTSVRKDLDEMFPSLENTILMKIR